MLICPICQAPLSAVENGVACPANHRFDRARQGYLNLLPVQHKNSRDPGDNQAMVEARRRFLDGGHYAPLARRLAELAAERTPQRWLDIGCGEGYYTAQLAAALPDAEGYALDISREAIKRACKRAPQLEWLLSPGGGLLRMGPTREHLWELRARLYDEVRDYDDEKHLSLIPDGMRLTHSETLSYELQLDDAQARADLLAMTPHGWRASAERRAAVIDTPLAVRVAIRYDWIERIS